MWEGQSLASFRKCLARGFKFLILLVRRSQLSRVNHCTVYPAGLPANSVYTSEMFICIQTYSIDVNMCSLECEVVYVCYDSWGFLLSHIYFPCIVFLSVLDFPISRKCALESNHLTLILLNARFAFV